MKKMKMVAVLIGLAACVLFPFAKTEIAKAQAQDSEYVKIDFTDTDCYAAEGTLVVLQSGASLGVSSKVETKETFTSFLLYVDVQTVAGECVEISFGENALRINANGVVYSEMTRTAQGRAFTFNDLQDGGVIMVEYIGGTVSVGLAGNTQPPSLLESPIAVFQTETASAPVTVGVATDEYTVLNLRSLRVYTLSPSITIEPDDWEVNDEGRPDKKAPEWEKTNGCGGVASGAWVALVGLGAGAALTICKKKEK